MTTNSSRVYHGTNLYAANLIKHYGVSLTAQRFFTDFGKGFYVTFNWKQAVRWANLRAYNPQVSTKLIDTLQVKPADYLFHPATYIPAIIAWDLNTNDLLRLKGRIFPFPDHYNWKLYKQSWEDFVFKCRNGYSHSYDFVYGPIAGGHFKHEEKIRVSRTKEQLSLNSNKAIACLYNLRIFPDVWERVRENNQELFIYREITEAIMELKDFTKEYTDKLLATSWVSSLQPNILIAESPYYWAFCILEGRNMLWHDTYEEWLMKKLSLRF